MRMENNKDFALTYLKKLLSDDEAIASFTVEGEYTPGYCIIPNEMDISHIAFDTCLDETLHRILDDVDGPAAEAEKLIRYVLLADTEKPDAEDDDVIEIDLGFRIHGPILSVEHVPLTAVGLQKTLYERYKLIWMFDHGYTLFDAFSTWRRYCSDMDSFNDLVSDQELFANWELDDGFSGSLYVCFDEFVGAEYQMGDIRLFSADAAEKRIWQLDQPEQE